MPSIFRVFSNVALAPSSEITRPKTALLNPHPRAQLDASEHVAMTAGRNDKDDKGFILNGRHPWGGN
jgi:hypothetical protein